jgi:hypothetical protein
VARRRLLHTLRIAVPLAGLLALAGGPACRVHYVGGFTPPRPILVTAEPPPAPVEEKPAAPYDGAVWIAGHHEWTAEGWIWLPGSYVRPRGGHRWVSPRYERFGERVRYMPGYWEPAGAATAAAVPVPPEGGGAAGSAGPLDVEGQAVDQAGAVTVTPVE